MKRAQVDITRLAHQITARLREAELGRSVEITIADGLVAEGDPQLLAVALENLLANAWKFTSKKASPHIEVGAQTVRGERSFFVRDDGAGSDPKYADKLFKPFQRLHHADEFPGTGIGLATVQRVLRRHGGRIWAESEPGAGATFFFTLP